MKKELGAQAVAFPTPVYIVASYCDDGKPNAMNVAWGGLCGSEPPCVAISIRTSRCTYENILEKKAFTVNIPGEEHMQEADYFGMVSGNKVDKFAAAGLTAVKSPHVNAPYIEEFPLCLECELMQTVEVGQHIQLIGRIVNVIASVQCLNEQGELDIEKIQPMLYDPVGNNYNAVGKVVGKAFSSGKSLM